MPTLPKGKRPRWIPKPEVKAYSKSKFYQTPAWRNLRAMFIANNPMCVGCEEKGTIRAGWLVDHIIPISQGGAALDEANLQTLCKHCHAVKTGKEQKRKK